MEKQLTPLQELIMQFEYHKNNNCKTMMEMLFFDGVITLAQNLLYKERETIMNAHSEGICSAIEIAMGIFKDHDWSTQIEEINKFRVNKNCDPSSQDYFVETFKQE